MSGEVVENFGTSIIGPIFVCCQMDEWRWKSELCL